MSGHQPWYRFYDKNYNLLWEGLEMPRVLMVTEHGHRKSFHIEIQGDQLDPELAAVRMSDNPILQEHQQLHRYMGGK